MPHFTIEAQGETNPLTVQSVFSTLLQTSGADQQGLQVAAKQLSNWEKHPGYYSLLQDVYADFSIDQNIRFQAILQLKNGVDKNWRKTAANAIRKEEKLKIRSQAIEIGTREPVKLLALHNAVLIAKIVRFEFPHDWPDVITTIIERLRHFRKDTARLNNLMVITLQVIKELAAGRLQRTKRSLQQVASELLHVVTGIYIELSEKWMSHQTGQDAMQISTWALKILRRLVTSGFEHPHRENDVQQLWTTLVGHQKQFWSLVSDKQPGGTEDDVVIKHLSQLSKMELEMAREHPAAFVLLPHSVEIIQQALLLVGRLVPSVLEAQQDEVSPLEKLSLLAMLLVRACVKMVFNPAQTFKYQFPQDKEDRKAAVDVIKGSVLTDEVVLVLMETLVTQYFVLRQVDLRDWQEEPDEWEKREEEIADAWEFSLRACAERLFLDLVINFKELLVPRLIQVFYNYASIDNTEVFLKDSLYTAIGVAAPCLEDSLDFNTFLCSTLVPEVQLTRPNYNLLRRRAAILLGQWVPIKPDTLDRRAIYQIFTHLLSQTDLNDAVVRVTAGRQLRLVLEPFESRAEDFIPFATPILAQLLSLVLGTGLSETQMALLETVRVIVTKLQSHIEPYANGIMSTLPSLWVGSGDEHLMKQAILSLIAAIVTSLGQKSLAYHSAVLPLIRDAVQPGSETMVYLLEDALDLWSAILRQTPTSAPSEELLFLSGSLFPLLQLGSEQLRTTLELLESYIILSPVTILNENLLSPLLVEMTALLEALKVDRIRDKTLAPQVVQRLVQVASMPECVQYNPAAVKQLVGTMIETGYLGKALAIIREAFDYRQDPRPSRKPPGVIGVGETSLFSVLARLALADETIFVEAVNAVGGANAIVWLTSEWIDSFDTIGDVVGRKLHALAITNLLTSSSPPPDFMLDQLQNLLTLWTDIATELGLDAPEQTQGDYLWIGAAATQRDAWPGESPEDERQRVLGNADPVSTINLRRFIADKLNHVAVQVGGFARFQTEWLGRVDKAVVDAFAALNLL